MMPSTSSVNIKSNNNQRNSSSTNYNESTIIPQIPRQILPMSRPTTVQSYQQPQIIVPTQCGFGDMLPNSNLQNSKEISSNASYPMDYYDNFQSNCFGPYHQHYAYYSQPHHQQQQIYSQQVQQQYLSQIQAQQQQVFMSKQHVQPATSFHQEPHFDMSTFCDECRGASDLCAKCKTKNKYIGFNNFRNSAVLQQQQLQQQNVQVPRVVSHTLSPLNNTQTSMNHSITPSHVVPTQTLNLTQMDTIPDYSMSMDFTIDQPNIYEENCDKNSKNKVLMNDVFFSDLMIDDTDEVFHFDSDSSSDTDISTPRQGYSPPLSPIDLMKSTDDFLWSMIEETSDSSKDKSSTEKPSTDISKFDVSPSSGSDMDSSIVKVESTVTTITIPSSTQSQAPVTTIDPTLICKNTIPTNTIDPKCITSSNETTTSSAVSQNVTKRLPPVITRPNHIDFGDGIPSPPLRTPELISDHSIKRKMSCESSSDDDMSDAESQTNKNDKRAQKKIRVDINKSIKINNENDRDDVEEEDDESDSSNSTSTNEEDDEVDSSNEAHDISDTVTDEYHYSSDTDSEEDDDEEYRPTNNNKRPRSTKKVIKPQGKARSTSSKGSVKTKSGMTKNKSKTGSTKRGKQSSKASKPSSKRSSGVNTPAAVPIESPPQSFSTPTEECQEMEGLEVTSPRSTQSPTIFQTLTKSGVDWCRYCGTTEGVNWRPGPWGKRTLCNKHGCDYKGYGFACKLPRLDLTGFVNESVEDRDRPVLQLFCTVCQKQESYVGNVLVRCEGCPKAFHQKCFSSQITDETVSSEEQWFCESGCSDNVRRKRIVVELPRKKLPLMSTPKVQVPVSTIETGSVPSGTVSRPRTSRNSSRV